MTDEPTMEEDEEEVSAPPRKVRRKVRVPAGSTTGTATTVAATAKGAGVLLATDAKWIYDEVDAALAEPGREVRWIRRGKDVLTAVAEQTPELVVLDLQIGNMGGMAACMALNLEEGAGRLPHVPVLMLLDREPDVFLARRCEADGWLVKPLDAIRLRKAAKAVLAGGAYQELVPEGTTAGAIT
jgi:DNA-binding response OmpR family regulator